MNRQETNTLIAEFMGYTKHITKHEIDMLKIYIDGKTYYKTVNNFNYHVSFDSIIPVIEKIEQMKNITVSIEKDCCYITLERYGFIVCDEWCKTPKIKIIYEAIIEFIKFYNNKENKHLSW